MGLTIDEAMLGTADEMFGDFEDLETGESHTGGADRGADRGGGADPGDAEEDSDDGNQEDDDEATTNPGMFTGW